MLNQLKSLNYYDELVKTLLEAKTAALASNIAAPLILVYILSSYINILILFSYLVFKFITLILRLTFANRGLKAIRNNNSKKIKKYLKLYLTTLFINSVLLASASVLAIIYGTTTDIFIVIALAFGMAAGAISTTATIFHATVLFIVPYMSFIFIALLLNTSGLIYYLSEFSIIIFMVITIPSTFRMFSSLKNNIEKTIKLKDQQKQLIQAERIASMAEIMNNIAHQWRQPLSIISTATSGLVLERENHILKDESFIKYTNLIMDNTQYLSKTIDEFRDFIETTPINKTLLLQDSITSAINITKAVLQSLNIKLIYTKKYNDDILLNMNEGELTQVLINIINNAKEAIQSKNIKDGKIYLSLNKINDNIIIEIEDNAKGIPSDIIGKIFEPYFTTKHNLKGTGLGLSTSHKIITKNLNGQLSVKNTALGAKFTIKLKI